jgi:hypothetical protein
MGCLGVHISLSADEVSALRAVAESERVDYFYEAIEDEYFANHEDRVAETDKAWDAIHRTLTDGEMSWDGGDYPLNHVILGGERLYRQDDFVMVLKTPGQVRDVAAALCGVTEADFRENYFAIDPDHYGFEVNDEDFGYTWYWFERLRSFWMQAAREERYILFTASQ